MFFICLILYILQKIWKDFLHSSSHHLILAQRFGPLDCLHSSWCNVFCKFLFIGLYYGLKFSFKVLDLYFKSRDFNILLYVQFYVVTFFITLQFNHI